MPTRQLGRSTNAMAAAIGRKPRAGAASGGSPFRKTLSALPSKLAQLRLSRSPAVARRKRALDIILAGAGLVVFAPLMALTYVIVRSDGGPAIFAQRRLGRDGQEFTCYKFRTMRVDAEAQLAAILQTDPARRAEWLRDRKLMNDPRITRVGRFLREKSVDELPQLWNVLRGDMSVVGPRPIVPDEIEMYGDKAADYFRCKPGLTGPWQVSGRNAVSYEDRVALDVGYLSAWTLRRDISIIARTFGVVIDGAGAR